MIGKNNLIPGNWNSTSNFCIRCNFQESVVLDCKDRVKKRIIDWIVGRCKFIVDKNKLIAGLQHLASRDSWRTKYFPFEQIYIYMYTFTHIQCWYVYICIHVHNSVVYIVPSTLIHVYLYIFIYIYIQSNMLGLLVLWRSILSSWLSAHPGQTLQSTCMYSTNEAWH